MRSRGAKGGIGNETFRAAIKLFHLDEIVRSNKRFKYDDVSSSRNPCMTSTNMEMMDDGDNDRDGKLMQLHMKREQKKASRGKRLEVSTPKSKPPENISIERKVSVADD